MMNTFVIETYNISKTEQVKATINVTENDVKILENKNYPFSLFYEQVREFSLKWDEEECPSYFSTKDKETCFSAELVDDLKGYFQPGYAIIKVNTSYDFLEIKTCLYYPTNKVTDVLKYMAMYSYELICTNIYYVMYLRNNSENYRLFYGYDTDYEVKVENKKGNKIFYKKGTYEFGDSISNESEKSKNSKNSTKSRNNSKILYLRKFLIIPLLLIL